MSSTSYLDRDTRKKNPGAGKRLAPLPGGERFASTTDPSALRQQPHSAINKTSTTTGLARRPSSAGDEPFSAPPRTTKPALTGKPRQPGVRRAAPATAAAEQPKSAFIRRESEGKNSRKVSSAQPALAGDANAASSPGKRKTSTVFRRGSKKADGEGAAQKSGSVSASPMNHRQSVATRGGASVVVQEPVSNLPLAPFDRNVKYYSDAANWNTNLPEETLEVVEGRKLEAPFTTLLWTQGYPSIREADVQPNEDPYIVNSLKANPKGKAVQPPGSTDPSLHRYPEKLTEGYYGCIRCAAPLFDPNAQVLNRARRGIATFQYINAGAVTVEIQTALTAGGAAPDRRASILESANEFSFSVCCKYCAAFVATTSHDIPAALGDVVRSGEIFLVNSCALSYYKYRTGENLYQVIAPEVESGEEEEEEEEDMFNLVGN
ncbi:hypothetical protein ADEAN_000857800 [Angomonas deanei]|uniref:Uncharacterized protein n=1 Tax=Angomonas deanei TaxID=59799 RepID=A0A7G2CQ01_9TRYP|nr:hypothetical protein ADEAN_000857800 [Angomonas deanei]